MQQVDAPQDPDAFVHRVGRSARMGARGRALILLTPSEQAYVGFLRLRKVWADMCATHAIIRCCMRERQRCTLWRADLCRDTINGM